MWRGYHKLGDQFESLSQLPSTYPISSDDGNIHLIGPNNEALFVRVVNDSFSASSCDSIIKEAELKGFKLALLNQGSGLQENGIAFTESRSSERCIIDDKALAEEMWPIIQQQLPSSNIVPGKRYKGWKAMGINSKFRVLKYSEGERFELHQDGSYRIEASADFDGKAQQSFMTLQLYLNDGGGIDFTGGATRFIEPILSSSDKSDKSTAIANVYDVVPRVGRLLLFQHNCWHEGERVVKGIKYVLRSEVMFTKET
mmetsp:Transcript_6365/g.6527  ORF Transcript_6365/g.6527 Transcript_6365/m.6527 type:complete len:256 (-) Transcript_6365:37-804(-)